MQWFIVSIIVRSKKHNGSAPVFSGFMYSYMKALSLSDMAFLFVTFQVSWKTNEGNFCTISWILSYSYVRIIFSNLNLFSVLLCRCQALSLNQGLYWALIQRHGGICVATNNTNMELMLLRVWHDHCGHDCRQVSYLPHLI